MPTSAGFGYFLLAPKGALEVPIFASNAFTFLELFIIKLKTYLVHREFKSIQTQSSLKVTGGADSWILCLVQHTWSNLPMKVCWQRMRASGRWQGAIRPGLLSSPWCLMVWSSVIFQQMFGDDLQFLILGSRLGIRHCCYDDVTLLREQIRTQFGKSSNWVFWQLHP